MKDVLTNANFPMDAEGRTYHVNTKSGQVANRIIVVGDHVRARRIAAHFDGGKILFEQTSQRNFTTLTGVYKGAPLTIVAIGMGFSMVDFFVRECRAVVEGDMIIVRIGSCGSINEELAISDVSVPRASLAISRDYDFFHPSTYTEKSSTNPLDGYHVTKPLDDDECVHQALMKALDATRPAASGANFGGKRPSVRGEFWNGSADSFYGSQGRIDETFVDDNQCLIAAIQKEHPKLSTLEMETYVVTHLALCANYVAERREKAEGLKAGSLPRIYTGAMQMIFANRNNQGFITPAEVQLMEEWCGKAVCEALAGIPIAEDRVHPASGSVWATSSISNA